jgi:hypothetical protein
MTLPLVALLSALCTLVVMYIDGRLFEVKRTKGTYLKNMALVSTVACAAVYFFSQLPSLQTGGTPIANLGASVKLVNGEQILTGLPNF